MTQRPVILVVDDQAAELASLFDAVSRRYSADYRVVSHFSANDAVEDLKRMRDAGETLALAIADQWMPEMDGVEFLLRVHEIHPTAQRALLVHWGDRDASKAILQGCALGQIENYLLKPWAPAEVHLYPLIGEFLTDWTRAHGGTRMELVRVVGSDPSPRCHELTSLLERNGIAHGFYLADSEAGRAILEHAGLDASKLPVVELLDGRTLVAPTNEELADALGFSQPAKREFDLVILGGGPAGLAAAVYAASEGLSTVVVEREAVGGQAGMSSLIRNYLGFPRGISGAELAQRAYQQAWLFGCKFVFAREATKLEAPGNQRVVTLSNGVQLSSRAVIVATGATYKRIPSLERFVGAGVYYWVPGDPRPLAGTSVYVAGGGNAAAQATLHLAKTAKKVTLLVRGDRLETGMSAYLVRQIRQRENIEVRLGTGIAGGEGERRLESLVLTDMDTGARETAELDALFVMIGAAPRTEWLAGTLDRDARGFIRTGLDIEGSMRRRVTRLETSIPGVYAVGDVRAGSVKRVASAVGEGSIAVQYIHEYLEIQERLQQREQQEQMAVPRGRESVGVPRRDSTGAGPLGSPLTLPLPRGEGKYGRNA